VTGWHDGPAATRPALLGIVLLALAPGVWPAAAGEGAAGDRVPATPLFAFTDPDVTESSGLVDAGDRVFTVNDSGSGPVLYAVDPDTGGTTATTTYSSDDVTDVEALAPGPGGSVWVGDIGDNLENRDSVEVYRVSPGDGASRRFELTYPDGARDAETLLAHPGSGRLFVVSKTPFGGVVYAAPTRLDEGATNRLTEFARVPGLLTDGSFLPSGRQVLLRGYGSVALYSFPGFELLGSARLPAQRQGEGLSVGAHGRVLVSSEGQYADVLQLELPRALRPPDNTGDTGALPGATVGPSPDATAVTDGADPAGDRAWLLAAAGALVLGGSVAAFALRRAHRRP
jgi:hypothetical protein